MLIVGALGFAKELLIVLQEKDTIDFCFFDNVTQSRVGCIFDNFTVLQNSSQCTEHFISDNRFLLGVGNVQARYNLYKEFTGLGGELTGIASSGASIGMYNQIDPTCTVMQRVLIENDNIIGKGVLLHVGSFISHDVSIGDFCEISPYAKLLGRCEVGAFTSVGTGAIILPDVKIGRHVIVGAGAVVTKDVEDDVTVYGVPAKKSNEQF